MPRLEILARGGTDFRRKNAHPSEGRFILGHHLRIFGYQFKVGECGAPRRTLLFNFFTFSGKPNF
ncbi:MAG: hypothetical protein RLZZ435_100 [Cyanobacteriota bacterium]|jgi:hypothetical protein